MKMKSSEELAKCFFSELKKFNSTNYKTLATSDVSTENATVHKAFSSVITRFFIFREKHPELTEGEFNLLYYKLKLDLIADYFRKYPDASADSLVAFQIELNNYIKESKEDLEDERATAV